MEIPKLDVAKAGPPQKEAAKKPRTPRAETEKRKIKLVEKPKPKPGNHIFSPSKHSS